MSDYSVIHNWFAGVQMIDYNLIIEDESPSLRLNFKISRCLNGLVFTTDAMSVL